MKNKVLSTLLLFMTAIIWGFAFVAQTMGGTHLEAFIFNGIRFALGALSLIPVYLIFEKRSNMSATEKKARDRYTFRASLVSGTILFIAASLQQVGINLTRDPGKSGFITGLYTALTPVLCFLLFRTKVTWNKWVGVLMASVGLFMLCVKAENGFVFGVAELVLFIGAVFWAGHIVSVDKFVKNTSPLRFSCWQFFVCAAENLLVSVFVENPTWEGVKGAVWPILYCGIMSVGVAFTCQILGQRMAEPTFAAIVFSSESVFAAIGGVLWNLVTPEALHVEQEITPVGYVGCAVIFAGIVISQISIPSVFKKMNRKS